MDDAHSPSEPQNPPDAPDITHAHGGSAGAPYARLEGDLAGLIARVDQHEAAIQAIDLTIVILAFGLGALAGLVYLQAKELRALTG